MSVQSINEELSSNTLQIISSFKACRANSIQLCKGLTPEDCQIQSMEDASPIKWHLAHTTWAIEVFFLKHFIKDYQYYDNSFITLFNSYYNGVGKQHLRRNRGLISKPNLDDVIMYRKVIEKTLIHFLNHHCISDEQFEVLNLVIQHEKQHQELMVMDIKHGFSQNDLMAEIHYSRDESSQKVEPLQFIKFDEGLAQIGINETAADEHYQFSFDNERPKHKYYVRAFELADRLTTNGEFLEFIQAGGYKNSLNWLSEGWAYINQNNIQCPLYWSKENSIWYEFTLKGKQPLDLNQPISHVSYYEAQAFANWKDLRLATEQEWEVASGSDQCKQMLGKYWQWTSSAYMAYPGFQPYEGKVSEYNGKFMSGQYVLRGGCTASPEDHIRPTYRNFFYPHQSWMFSSIRLAKDSV